MSLDSLMACPRRAREKPPSLAHPSFVSECVSRFKEKKSVVLVAANFQLAGKQAPELLLAPRRPLVIISRRLDCHVTSLFPERGDHSCENSHGPGWRP